MKRFIYSLSLFILTLTAILSTGNGVESKPGKASPATDKSQYDVIRLTSRDFDSKVASGGVWLVEFYADWCGHCKRFAPTYSAVAKSLHEKNEKKEDSEKIFVSKVDGAKERILSSRFSLRGYPTFFVIDGWDVYEYEGQRSLDALEKFVERGYKKNEPLPFYSSPFGPIGQTRALIVKGGILVLDQYQNLTEAKKYSPVFATMILASVAVVVGTFFILMVGILLVSKQKVD